MNVIRVIMALTLFSSFAQTGFNIGDGEWAARNILQRGLEIGRGPLEYKPVGDVAATQLSEAGQVASMNQEAHPFRGG